MREINPWSLGGTLFVPAVHQGLSAILTGTKFPSLRSVVIDTEDGITQAQLEPALEMIRTLLNTLERIQPLCFIRARSPHTLNLLLGMPGIDKIDGFVLPKFDLDTMEPYLKLLGDSSVCFMPSIEGISLFDRVNLVKIRTALLPYRSRIPLIRFGAEDMLRQLRLRRDCSLSLFDMAVPSSVIASLMAVFKPYGFEISGAVYRCFNDQEGFKQDVLRDLREGLVSKTIIHPNQIEPLEECYRVSEAQYQEARRLLSSESAVFSLGETMAEVPTQRPWGETLLLRKELYGIITDISGGDHPE
ncbi:MAG: HpcH/HpaI aldolase/citrate lyase family protein [Sulfuricurvum sp.]|nr:HpcH/HpaI aldolase/citrate lyase family protein [Sulfuricurvum sp.]